MDPMKHPFLVPVVVFGTLVSARAEAANKYSCCDLSVRDGACVSQSDPCAPPVSYGVALEDIDTAPAGYGLLSGITHEAFPSGINGYLSITHEPPWVGFCLDAPSNTDPMHVGATEPVECLTLSMAPGVSADIASATVPADPRWDAHQVCYGKAVNGFCAGVNNTDDPTVYLTPSGSCCGPAERLVDGQIPINQEIPGVPPSVLVFAADGGIKLDYNPDAGDTLGPVPHTCLTAYNQPANCGMAPSSAPCVPASCSTLPEACGMVSDGCGGTISCGACAPSSGGRPMTTINSAGGCDAASGDADFVGALLFAAGAGALRLRKKRAPSGAARVAPSEGG